GGTRPTLRGVLGVDAHVLVGEVRGEDARAPPPLPDRDLDRDLLLLHGAFGAAQRGLAARGLATAQHLDAADPDARAPRAQRAAAGAHRLHDPAPVRVAAEQRSLHQRRVRDRAREPVGVAITPRALDGDRGELGHSLTVARQLLAQLGA